MIRNIHVVRVRSCRMQQQKEALRETIKDGALHSRDRPRATVPPKLLEILRGRVVQAGEVLVDIEHAEVLVGEGRGVLEARPLVEVTPHDPARVGKGLYERPHVLRADEHVSVGAAATTGVGFGVNGRAFDVQDVGAASTRHGLQAGVCELHTDVHRNGDGCWVLHAGKPSRDHGRAGNLLEPLVLALLPPHAGLRMVRHRILPAGRQCQPHPRPQRLGTPIQPVTLGLVKGVPMVRRVNVAGTGPGRVQQQDETLLDVLEAGALVKVGPPHPVGGAPPCDEGTDVVRADRHIGVGATASTGVDLRVDSSPLMWSTSAPQAFATVWTLAWANRTRMSMGTAPAAGSCAWEAYPGPPGPRADQQSLTTWVLTQAPD